MQLINQLIKRSITNQANQLGPQSYEGVGPGLNGKLSPLSRGCISSILSKNLTILLHAVIDEGPKALLKGKSKTGRANVWNCHHRHRIYDYHNNGCIIHEPRGNKIQGGIAATAFSVLK